MKSRCRNKNDPSFKDYGGRGIGFDPAWDGFERFLADMGERPRGTTLDRKLVDGDYTRENCRWAPIGTQARNKRSNRLVEFRGEMRPLVEVAELTGVPYQRLHERIVRRGWSVVDAIEKPPRGFR
jgi:hypothetical protein